MARASASLLTVPPEIRDEIYRYILHPDASRQYHEDEYCTYNYAPALTLLRVNRQIHNESKKMFHALNTFVRIETPWQDAQKHVATEGHVPIVVPSNRAPKFDLHRMSVIIDAPDHMVPESETQRFVLLAEDLPSFGRMWFYSDLTYPNLNQHLRLTLRLRDPFTPPYEEKRMTKALQRQLILPFCEVRNLHSETIVDGEVKAFPTLVSELRARQAEPHVSPERCLSECARLKQLGNAELVADRPRAALALYADAWLAIHIVVKGRQRHIHADKHFAHNLTDAPYAGKNGQTERLLLRVQLVANTCMALLKLEDFDRCRFWGMRTIHMLREAMGAGAQWDMRPEDEAITGFPGAEQMGKIYYRTALAAKAMGDEGEARKLLRVARIYLPNDKTIAQEIEATALRLG